MRKLNTRQLYKTFHKQLDELPFIIMKNQKPYAMVVAYEDVEEKKEEYTGVEFRAAPIIKDEQPREISGFTQLYYNGNNVVQEPQAESTKGKPTTMQRLKQILTMKVF